MRKNKKIIFFVNEDRAFFSHRLFLAKAILSKGFDVLIITRVHNHGEILKSHGFKVINIEIKRSGINPFTELKIIRQLIKYYKQEQPDLVYHVALKPVLYGTLAAHFSGVKRVINLLTGLGYIFSSRTIKARLLKRLVLKLLKFILNIHTESHLIVQNEDDYNLLTAHCLLGAKRVHVIRGSGVNIEEFSPLPETEETPVVVLAARMLWDKGVGEFVAAAKLLKIKKIKAKMVLVGDVDLENPSSISRKQLDAWHQQGFIEWWGHSSSMPEIFRRSHIVCLPSYREGFPKVLLEAAASGRPIITTVSPGCREIVQNEKTGLLVPPRNVPALANAIERLVKNKALREKFGNNGRSFVIAEFSNACIFDKNFMLCRNLLSEEG